MSEICKCNFCGSILIEKEENKLVDSCDCEGKEEHLFDIKGTRFEIKDDLFIDKNENDPMVIFFQNSNTRNLKCISTDANNGTVILEGVPFPVNYEYIS